MSESEPSPHSYQAPRETPPGASPRPVERHAIPWGQRAELELNASAASVTVTPLTEGEKPYLLAHGPVEVHVRERGTVTSVELSMREGGGFWSFLWRSMPQVELFLPADARARLKLDAGMVRVAGLKDCELEVSTEAGAADLRDVHGKLTLRASAGSILGQRVGGTFDVQAAAGSVKLEIDALAPGEHRMVSQMGSVDVRLVPGLDVAIDARTSLGSVRNSYPTRPGAPVVLRLETDLGSVRVRESHKLGREEEGEEPRGWEHDARRWQRQAERWQRRAERHAERWARGWGGPPPWAEHGRPPVPRPGTTGGIPDEELRRVLQLVHEQKVSVDDAEKLLRAMQR
ncbi:hypothetical protein JY651_36285 [Pyxidicoccus parkwayensis]|uniref:Adhesin domain-containing protein n=1 Tax=Pyxidicoccus parkwayensis TaxID=2813578 RepID=A0ABX7NP70_9BACT|nr:hypothetical protein [Pyxidicoccus parkwaysis]QSQ20654.1 hypothetical protein JY651_36285 [Pyxidicoccus parkwaysis]